MEKFIPYGKLSKKEKRKIDQARRQTWGELNPVTRKSVNSKAYNRRKSQDWKRKLPPTTCDFFPIDYSATKGAIVALTRSLALSLAEQGIRVNAVAPDPIWTPLIPASYSAKEVQTSGTSKVPMFRAGQPREVAASYVFLASDGSSYMTGQVSIPTAAPLWELELLNGPTALFFSIGFFRRSAALS